MDSFWVPFKKLFSGKKRALGQKKTAVGEIGGMASTNFTSSASSLPKEDSCGKRCNILSVTWFWITVFGVVYLGFEYILPVMYDSSAILCNKIIAYLILIELSVNWFFLKFVKSPFKANMHMEYIREHDEEIKNGGFEINMNDLKESSGGIPGNFKISKSSIGSNVNKNLLSGTLYVIEMNTIEDEKPHDSNLYSDSETLSFNSNSSNITHKNSQPKSNANGIISRNASNSKRKLVYPYWSWKPCVICQHSRPPRAHHCPICSTCVLKRDHHCYFTGSCIGVHNQRYFVTFVFWGTIATVFVTVQSLIYYVTIYVPQNHWVDIILPVGVIKWGLGYVKSLDLFKLILLYSVGWFCITAMAFLREQINCIRRGITSFEQDAKIRITCIGNSQENLKAVFGEYWYLNFIMPLHWVYPGTDDGVSWPKIKA